MTIIYAATEDQHLVATILPKLAQNNVNTVRLSVDFDASWSTYTTRRAIFTTSKSVRPYSVNMSSGGDCLIPPEVLAEECQLYIVVEGVNYSTDAKKSSTRLTVKVLGGHPAVIISDPSPSVYQQLLMANSVLASRMSGLEAAGTVDGSEVIGIRTGADGKVYNTAGDAVRATTGALMQVNGGLNPLQPLLFDQYYFYRGASTAVNVPLSTASYNLTDLDAFRAVSKSDGTSFGIFGKLVAPLPVVSSWSGAGYSVVIKSDKAFSANVAATYAPAWGGTTIVSTAVDIKAGYNIIPLGRGESVHTDEGHTQYRFIGLYGLSSGGNSFDYGELNTLEVYIVHSDALLGLIEDHIAEGEEYITCWGDSLTAQGGWTTKLQELSGMTVYNAGTGGENVRTITARQGADVIMVNDVTIPATSTPVTLATYTSPFRTALGYTATPLLQGGAHVNPVKLGDIEGTLKWTGSSYSDTSGTWTFTRTEAGEQVVIDRPTALTTAYDREKNSPHLMVIFMGQNGGYNSDDEELVNLHRLMIAHANAKHVIILGLSSGSATSRAGYEAAMKKAFGRYFISLREYLSQYGLADAGLTPTTADSTAMLGGTVPPQLFTDGTHYTAAAKTVIGNLIYKRCCELGIFEA